MSVEGLPRRRTTLELQSYVAGFEAGAQQTLRKASDIITDPRDLEQLQTGVEILLRFLRDNTLTAPPSPQDG